MMDDLLLTMGKYLKLGFELDLYSSYEYTWIYWYMENIQLQRRRNFSLIDQYKKQFAEEEEKLNSNIEKKAPNSGKSKKGRGRGRGRGRRGRGRRGRKAAPKSVPPPKKNKKGKKKDTGPSPVVFNIESELFLIRGINRILGALDSLGKVDLL